MTRQDGTRIAVGATGILLGAGLILSHGALSRARALARNAAEELSACRRLAREIESLRERPHRAETAEIDLSALTRHIEEASREAGIAPERLSRIEPQPARRLGDGPYKEKPTRVEMDRVPLRALLAFLHRLTGGGRGLGVREIRLRAPHGEDLGDAWVAELTLGYLIYAPEDRSRAGAATRGGAPEPSPARGATERS